MRAVEALQKLINIGDEVIKEEGVLIVADLEEVKLATSVTQAMLNTALPIARFRCHVEFEKIGSKSLATEFTLCGVTIESIKIGLVGISSKSFTVSASLWEQKPEGASMLSGYRGSTRVRQYQLWLDEIEHYQGQSLVQ